MVICAYAIEKNREENLKKLGVKDSKELTPEKRSAFFKKLREIGEYEIVEITAEELTELMNKKISLNEIEALKIGEVLNSLWKKFSFQKVFIDAPDPIAEKFGARIKKYFKEKIELIAEHKADSKYPVVSAASIIAKVKRDEELEAIKKEFGTDFGNGYPHSIETREFIKKNIKDPRLNKYIRWKWKTMKDLKLEQIDLSKFL